MTERRALLTDREREIVAGDADVEDSYRYQTISRVRARFDRLEEDLEALEKHGDLADELREIVCRAEGGQDRRDAGPEEPSEATPATPAPAGGERDTPPDTPLEDALAGLDTTADRRDAVRACVEYLREQETAQKSGFVDAVYPEHAAGFGSAGGWWNKIGKEYLQAVAEDVDVITPPAGEGSHTWRYSGEM